MDADKETENVAENKVYESIFNIFEQELEEISHFVAFTSGNLNSYSNKIHELHLRVCSEIENVLKNVIHKHFVSEGDVKALWEDAKSNRLKQKNLFSAYEYLAKKLNLNNQKKNDFDNRLFGYEPGSYYFELACKKFNLHKKVIRFTGMISNNIDWEIIQPFELKQGRNVPIWWTSYNKLKHDKITNFHLCTLKDLVYSLSGLFILMNYLLKYQENNSPIENTNYLLERMKQNVFISEVSFCAFDSKFFSATNSYQNIIYPMLLPQKITEDSYQNLQLGDLANANNFISNEHKLVELKNINLKSFEHKMKWANEDGNKKSESIEHSIFYTYLDYLRVVDFSGTQYRELRHYGIFTN